MGVDGSTWHGELPPNRVHVHHRHLHEIVPRRRRAHLVSAPRRRVDPGRHLAARRGTASGPSGPAWNPASCFALARVRTPRRFSSSARVCYTRTCPVEDFVAGDAIERRVPVAALRAHVELGGGCGARRPRRYPSRDVLLRGERGVDVLLASSAALNVLRNCVTPKYCPLDREPPRPPRDPGETGAGSSVAPIRPASVLFAASERSGAQHHAARTDSGLHDGSRLAPSRGEPARL